MACLAAGVALAIPVMSGGVWAAEQATAADPGFSLDTGQINRGFDPKNPTASQTRPVPTPAQAQAAMMQPVSTQPALGTFGNVAQEPASANATTGLAGSGQAASAASVASAAPTGPIGAIGATMPAKFSARNDILDRVPIMALPLPLSTQERKAIYQAVMAKKTPAASGADKLGPASILSSDQYFNDTHPLPGSVGNIGVAKGLAYVKAKNKVLLVEPSTRVVFDEINS
jgi:hypothetical protein